VKLTCCRTAGGCPRGKPCGVCRSLSGPFEVVEDYQTLAQPGKDTARLLHASGGRAVWLKARPDALADGLAAALALFEDEQAVLVEGNAAFQVATPMKSGAIPVPTSRDLGTGCPDLGILVIGPGPEPAKPTVRVALPHISAIVLNARPGFPAPVLIHGLPEEVRTFSFDAAKPEGDPQARAFVRWVAARPGLNVAPAIAAARDTRRAPGRG
jgi:hypothetical protein